MTTSYSQCSNPLAARLLRVADSMIVALVALSLIGLPLALYSRQLGTVSIPFALLLALCWGVYHSRRCYDL